MASIIVHFVFGLSVLLGLTPIIWFVRAKSGGRKKMAFRLLLGGMLGGIVAMSMMFGFGHLLKAALSVPDNDYISALKWVMLVYVLAFVGMLTLSIYWGGTDFDSNEPLNPTWDEKQKAAAQRKPLSADNAAARETR